MKNYCQILCRSEYTDKKSMMVQLNQWLKSLFLYLLLTPSIANAYFYAYIPDLTTEKLHVVNTDLNVMVEAISLFGKPRDILVDHSGKSVYISSVVDDSTVAKSYVNIINTRTNKSRGYLPIDYSNVRGMAISKNDEDLYVTHKEGVTKISNPLVDKTYTEIVTTYRGITMAFSEDDKYLFVLGSDNVAATEAEQSNIEYGISVIDTGSNSEIFNYRFGVGKNSSAIVFDNLQKKLFIAHRDTDEIESLSILNYDNASSLSLTSDKSDKIIKITNDSISSPAALLLNKNKTELFVALSYLVDDIATGEGYVLVLDAKTLTTIKQVDISNEKSTYQSTGIVHPVALSLADDGKIFLLKRIFSDKAGLYVSQFDDYISPRTSTRYINEVNSFLINNKASIFSNGKFIGADCSDCPTGVEDPLVERQRPAALNPLFIFILVIVYCLRNRIR